MLNEREVKRRPKLSRPKKDVLNELYWIKMLSEGQIALHYHVEPETIIEWLIKYDIPLKGYYESRQINFRRETGIPAATEIILTTQMPFSCNTSTVVLHFPPGCNGLVQVNLQLANGTVIFPYDGKFIALDSATQMFEFEYYLNSGTILDCKISNTDDTNAHDVQVIVSIKRLNVMSVK